MSGQKHVTLKLAFRWCECGTDDEVLCTNIVHIRSCFIGEFYSQSDLVTKMISGGCVYIWTLMIYGILLCGVWDVDDWNLFWLSFIS